MTVQRQRPGVVTRGVADTVDTVSSLPIDHLTAATPSSSAHPEITELVRLRDLLLWGWPDLLSATGIPRRTLERELAAGRFPKPVLRVGRRPYWDPRDVCRWAHGGADE
jgi:hypothetical protein